MGQHAELVERRGDERARRRGRRARARAGRRPRPRRRRRSSSRARRPGLMSRRRGGAGRPGRQAPRARSRRRRRQPSITRLERRACAGVTRPDAASASGRGGPKTHHFSVSRRCLVLETEQVERAVGGEERDLAHERVPAALRLPRGLRRADQDVAHVERPSTSRARRDRGSPFARPTDCPNERTSVVRSFFRCPRVQRTHLDVTDERDRDARVAGSAYGLTADRTARRDRREIARRVAADGESQRPEASGGGVAAGGRRAMRSSGYGIRS